MYVCMKNERAGAERCAEPLNHLICLQATQAGNQLLALQSQQLADLTAAVASQGRAQALEAARNAATEAEGRERFKRFRGN